MPKPTHRPLNPQVGARVPENVLIEIKVLATRQRRRFNELVEEAFHDLLTKYREKSKGKWARMRKLDLARRIHQKAGISEPEAATLLNWILEFIKATLQQGKRISIQNFGVFTVRKKASRNGRNPRTGQPVIISSRNVVSFRASSRLKAEVSFVPSEVNSRSADWIDGRGLADKHVTPTAFIF